MMGKRFVTLTGVLLAIATLSFASVAHGQVLTFPWQKKEQLPVVFPQVPTQQQLLATLNSRYQSIRQLDSDISISMSGAPTKIKGTLQVEFPSRLRMKAGVAGFSGLGIDVGSNENEFWIFSKVALPGSPPAFYFANQQAFKQSAIHRKMPLDPKWLVDAIGLVQFSPNVKRHGPVVGNDGRMRLYSVEQTAAGPQTTLTLISIQTGLIEQQAIYDSQNKRVVYSNSTDYKNYTLENGRVVSLPQRIEIHLTQPGGTKDETMYVTLREYSIDSLYGDPRKMWAMPDANGVQKIDLARVGTMGAQASGATSQPFRQLGSPGLGQFGRNQTGTGGTTGHFQGAGFKN